MIFAEAKANPDGLALDDLSRQRTWATLADRVTRIARLLRGEYRLAPGEHVAFLMGNRVECIELTLGAILAGLWVTPVNRHLQKEEIDYVITDSGARVLFADDEHAAQTRRRNDLQVLLVGSNLDAALAAVPDDAVPLDTAAGGTMIYTSGTTGRPKGVCRARPVDAAAALAAQSSAGTALGLDGSGPHLVAGPLYHAAPLLFAIYDQANGAPIIILPRWDAALALRLIEERGIHHTHMVPTMFVRLLRRAGKTCDRSPPGELHLVLHGAAPISPDVKRRMIGWWGPVLVEYWGASESGVVTLVDSDDWLAHPGTVGRPIATFEVFAGDGDGQALPPGEAGTLYCRHRRLQEIFRYHKAPRKTAATYLEPGVIQIGDLGRVDEDGYVYLTGRHANTIISGGVNIYPAEIEEVLQRHPAVADVAVFGVPDEEWGEVVKAAVEPAGGYHPDSELAGDLLVFARKYLAGYKVPRSVDFESRLPRHPTGKLHTRLLREPYWRGRERKI